MLFESLNKIKWKTVFNVMIYTTTTVFRSSIMKNTEKMLRFITSTNASSATVKLGKKSLQEKLFFSKLKSFGPFNEKVVYDLSEPPCKDDNARFKRILLNLLSN